MVGMTSPAIRRLHAVPDYDPCSRGAHVAVKRYDNTVPYWLCTECGNREYSR